MASVNEKMVIILDIDMLIDTGVLGNDAESDDDESQALPAIS